ncbi:hypothetical protein OY671_011558 [Metschnikowia pulcherrima]|nr:hypothetical protein OY671_011558 [Metschnikowia pulcherrima]
MPIHFRHDAKPGGPLRGAAFPIISPHHDPEERAARVQIEHEQPHKMLGSAIHNAVPAVKSESGGNKSVIAPRQTWDDPSKIAPAANHQTK